MESKQNQNYEQNLNFDLMLSGSSRWGQRVGGGPGDGTKALVAAFSLTGS